MDKFVSSGEIHEAWVEFINDSVQFIPQIIIYRTDTYEMDFILDTVAQFAKSLFWWDGAWFVIPSILSEACDNSPSTW